jgi:A118 family predicted phage portal protein
MLKKVANQYATVVFNEQCEINVDGKAAEFVQGVFEHNDFKKNFSKYLEPMFALGGLVCRPYIDKQTNKMEFSWALADAFYPLQSNTNNISECAIPFVTTRTNGRENTYYTLLEFHEWDGGSYVITNELYRSSDSNIVGAKVPLSELYDDLESTTSLNGLSRPIFAYLKPSGFNNISPYSPLGLGVCDNCKKTLDRINRTYDEFDQEVRRGKRRIAVSEMLMNSRVDELNNKVKMFFDEDEDTFQIIPGANMDDYTIKDLSSEIRTKEYTEAINHHLKTLEMETSLSVGTFTFDANGVRSTKTATEIVSENSQTYQTRAMQITEVEKFIKELVVSVCELGKAFKIYNGPIPVFNDIGVDFNDGAFQNRDAQLDFYMKLVNLGYPVNKVLETVLDLPKDEALQLYQEGMRQRGAGMTGIFDNPPLEE